MMEYSLEKINEIVKGKLFINTQTVPTITDLQFDSRKAITSQTTLFFCIKGERQDGHNYIEELCQKGITNFVITDKSWLDKKLSANFILVPNSLQALQKLAIFHRNKFKIPVIGITGSNGKTIIKEWLYALLQANFEIIRSPKSYNSQLGVPLSVWKMSEENTLGIFEAGISTSDEMDKLEKIIQPTLGVFTNIGEAHGEGFISISHKAKEKLKLFQHVEKLIYCKDHGEINAAIASFNSQIKEGETDRKIKTFTWSKFTTADLQVQTILTKGAHTFISTVFENKEIDFEIPFVDKASIENAIHCLCVLLVLKISTENILEGMRNLSKVAMRLVLKDGINNTALINDSYNSDIQSIRIALDFLKMQNQFKNRTLILSDILQSGKGDLELYEEVAQLIEANEVTRLVAIGKNISRQKNIFSKNKKLKTSYFESTSDFITQFSNTDFQNEVILLKGARVFQFEQIAKLLEKKTHATVLEINLNNLVNNLKTYQSMLLPSTRVMAMVKAFSYGSGAVEIANTLQFNHVDYLAVAYTDEGVLLRQNGIKLPIMVMNPELESFSNLIKYNLEPSIYTPTILADLIQFLNQQTPQTYLKIHIEIETGMNRLGFEKEQLELLIKTLKSTERLLIASVFSHLAGSEEANLDDFTNKQIALFKKCKTIFEENFSDIKIIFHILNTHGIGRHSSAQLDMVRLGIGLYGIDENPTIQKKLQVVGTLRTIISQIKTIKKGETVGYNRKGKTSKDTKIATIGIGYADGISRRFGMGVGRFFINGKSVPTIGNICMDMTMLDVTELENVHEGDEVIIFGENPTVKELANSIGTIPYEILTSISGRVKRAYLQE